MTNNCMEKIPRSFLLGISLGCVICIIGLLIHIGGLHSRGEGPEGLETSSRSPIVTLKPPRSALIPSKDSKLGIYSQAAVASDAQPCAKIGVDIMHRNGTAVDAAIAVEVCASVVHSMSHGIGGGFIMTVYIKQENKAYSLMARETAPASANKDMFINAPKGASRTSGLAIGIPGEVSGLYAAKERFGNPALSMFDLLEPSIRLCEEGFTVTNALQGAILKSSKKYEAKKAWKDTFTNPVTGKYYTEGDIIKMPKLGSTLRMIAEDERTFYEGKLADMILEDLKQAGSIITEQDLQNYKSIWEDPVQTRLSNSKVRVYSSPPPASGAIMGAILNIMDQFNHTEADFSDPVTFHHFVEACKYGFAKRTKMGDWNDLSNRDTLKRLVEEVTSERFARETRHSIRGGWTSNDWHYYGADFTLDSDAGTTHTSVMGENGDAVSITSTINTYFGSGIVSPQTGIIFNNEMDDFSTPGLKNAYGIEPSKANFIAPGRRPVSSMTPTIIVDNNGDVKLVVGASGGPKIITGTAWVSMMHLWAHLNIKEAIDSPRLHHQLLPMKVTYFPGTDPQVVGYLESVGHNVSMLPASVRGSVVQGIAIEGKGIVTANNDFRKSGQVDGF